VKPRKVLRKFNPVKGWGKNLGALINPLGLADDLGPWLTFDIGEARFIQKERLTSFQLS